MWIRIGGLIIIESLGNHEFNLNTYIRRLLDPRIYRDPWMLDRNQWSNLEPTIKHIRLFDALQKSNKMFNYFRFWPIFLD